MLALDNYTVAEEKAQEYRIDEFEARVRHTINSGVTSRESAIRWILQGEDLLNERDTGYVCHSLGLPHSLDSQINKK